jgi:hypothetical protein
VAELESLGYRRIHLDVRRPAEAGKPRLRDGYEEARGAKSLGYGMATRKPAGLESLGHGTATGTRKRAG